MIDMLGHPVEAGMKVLTSDYWQPSKKIIAMVKKVSNKSVIVSLRGATYNTTTKKWDANVVLVRRKQHQILVVDAQLEYNRKHFPEHAI